jgi:ATPase subunit of ABC transporter with duplicated ATPase domains
MSVAPLLEARALTIETPRGRTLVRELDLCLGRERVAVVGRNGVGKSTLLDVLAGRQEPARGRVVRRGRHLLVPQDQPADSEAGPGAGASAGERQRQRLETARAARPDLLLLDEPTRDLDAGNIAWLLDWVSRWQGGLLIVSHDRRVLRTFDQFFIMAESGCRHLAGGFDDLLAELERERADTQRRYLAGINRLVAREEHHAAVRRRRQRKKNVGRIRELKRCPARIKLNDKRSYKQESQGKRRVLQEARIGAARTEAKAARRALRVELPLQVAWAPLSDGPHPSPLPPGEVTGLISCEAVTARAGGRTLFSELSLEIGRDRVAVRGPNGSGKTTLLEVALGLRQPAGGRARCDASRVGYVAQNAANWRIDDSVLDQLATQMEAASPDRISEVLHAHRFPLALAGRPLATLSPGERVRAALICLGHRRPAPDLLVLDEPTQDLDFVGLEALEAVLAAWPGGLLVVSHDPEFLDAIGISRTLAL